MERIASAIAAFSVFGQICSEQLRGSKELIINAMGVFDGPVNDISSNVFIPRLAYNLLSANVFCVLINAVAGEGAIVVTDILEIDTATRKLILPRVLNFDFAKAAVEALRILGANMIASDQGPLHALALIRGLHKVVSVVSHIDEGGIHRDLFRCGGFGVPFGGIHYGLDDYAAFPVLITGGLVEVTTFVDSLALTSAALVAHCDPGFICKGNWYPTLFLGTRHDTPILEPIKRQVGTDDMIVRNRNEIIAVYPTFLEKYCVGLGRMFGASGDTGVATRFQAAMAQNLSDHNRHLRLPSMTPHFWIEPKSLIPHDFLGTEAENQGFASIGGKFVSRDLRSWENIEQVGVSKPAVSTYIIQMRSARTSGFLLHYQNHPGGGLGAVRVCQADPAANIQPGAGTRNENVQQRIMYSEALSEFLWIKGQNFMCAPGELLALEPTYGILVRHNTMDDDGNLIQEQVPSQSEFLHVSIHVSVGLPIGIVTGKISARNSQVKRARARATKALAAAASRARMYGSAQVDEMITSLSAPRFWQKSKLDANTDNEICQGPTSDLNVLQGRPNISSTYGEDVTKRNFVGNQ